MSFKERYQIVSTLGKFSISFPVGFTAFLGYVVVKQVFDIYSLAVFAGIFLLRLPPHYLTKYKSIRLML